MSAIILLGKLKLSLARISQRFIDVSTWIDRNYQDDYTEWFVMIQGDWHKPAAIMPRLVQLKGLQLTLAEARVDTS